MKRLALLLALCWPLVAVAQVTGGSGGVTYIPFPPPGTSYNSATGQITGLGAPGSAINITNGAYRAKADTLFASYTISITSGQNILTATGATFTGADVGKLIAVPGAGTTPTVASVAITGTAGQFSCTCTNLAVGNVLAIAGTYGGTGSITGYVNPTNYYVSATNGTSTFTLVAGGGAALVTTAGTPTGLTYTVPANLLSTTIAGFTNATTVTLTANAGTTVTTVAEVISYGTDNATALSAAITAAQTGKAPLYIPAPAAAECYGYTPPLTITANLKLVGDYVQGNFNGGINVPLGVPALLGSVLCPVAANGTDAIDITGTSLQVEVSNLGILFQNPTFSGLTGHGFKYDPSPNQGLTGSYWRSVYVYGHDGNHYAYYLTNFISDNFIQLTSDGGGGFFLSGQLAGNYGNSVFVSPYVQELLGGTAHGFSATASTYQFLNLLTFIRPQANTFNVAAATPSGNQPTAGQNTFYTDGNVPNIRMVAPDFETQYSSPVTLSITNNSSSFDLSGGLFSSPIQLPSWAAAGPIEQSTDRTLTDTTSSGTIALEAGSHIGQLTLKAASSTTVTELATLYVPAPVASTNVTAGTLEAIKTNGAIVGTFGQFSAGFNTFGAAITENNNSNFNTSINTGSSTGNVGIQSGTGTGTITIGNSGNTGKTTLAGISTGTNADFLCLSAGGVVLLQTSACTISSARFKEHIEPLARSALNAIAGLVPASFNMRGSNRDSNYGQREVGLIAENVQAAMPECSIYEPGEHGKVKSYRPECVIAFVAKAVQEATQAQQRAAETLWWAICGLTAVVLVIVVSFMPALRRRFV